MEQFEPDHEATRVLAAFAAEARASALPPEVVHAAKRIVLDTVGCGLAGLGTEIGGTSLRWAQRRGAIPEATVIGSLTRYTAATAACVNARLCGAISADETFPAANQTSHHGSAVVGAALAAAERGHMAGADALAAVAVGYEVGARIALGFIPGADVTAHGKGLRPGGYGPGSVVGATMAASRASGLPADLAVQAVGIAGMHIGGAALKWFEASPAPMVKSADPGWHAMTGVFAAEMAEDGFTGYETILDGPTGLWRGLGYDGCDFGQMLAGLGSRWFLLDACFKAWPAQHWMHQALTALDSVIATADLRADDIDEIVLRSNFRSSAPRFSETHPPGEIERAFNFPHAAAMLALRVPSGPRWVDPDLAADDAVRRIRERVRVEIEPASNQFTTWVVDGVVREMPASVTVNAKGRAYESSVTLGLGDPWSQETYLSDDQLADKFRSMAAVITDGSSRGAAAVDHIIEALMMLDTAPDIAATMSLLALRDIG